MDQTARAAFVIAQAACAAIESAAMQTQNAADFTAGRPMTYQQHDFLALPDKYGIHHNAVISYLGER
jgi:hypothetical protein